MRIFKNRFKAFKLDQLIFEYSDEELKNAGLTKVERRVLQEGTADVETLLELALVITRGIKKHERKLAREKVVLVVQKPVIRSAATVH